MAECLLQCRLRDLIRYCGCIYYPYPNFMSAPNCYIDDIPCLDRWRSQWFNSDTLATNERNDEYEDSRCPDCLPRCNWIRYNLDYSYSQFHIDELPITSNTAFLFVLFFL